MAKDMYRTDVFKGPLMRISFAWQLFKPRENKRDTGETYSNFGCTLIVPKGEETLLLKALQECVLAQWPSNGVERWKNGMIRNPLLAGDGKEARSKTTGEIHPGFGAGVSFIRVTSNRAPIVLAQNRLPITDPTDLPSGSWGYPGINAYCWHNDKNGDGISFGIASFLLDKAARGDEVLGGTGGVDVEALYGPAPSPSGPASGKPGSAASMFD